MDAMDAEEARQEHFALFVFKVEPCSQKNKHPWDSCPFCHPQENARRRDVRKYRYLAEACPDYKSRGFCALGNECPFAHGVFEINLHPSKYRTQMCVEGARCARKMCFFAHGPGQLRQPDHSYGFRTTAEAEAAKQERMAALGPAQLQPRAAASRLVSPGTPPQASPPRRWGGRERQAAKALSGTAGAASLLGLDAAAYAQPQLGLQGDWSALQPQLELLAAEQLLRQQQAAQAQAAAAAARAVAAADAGPRISMRVRRELGLEPPAKARAHGSLQAGSPTRGAGRRSRGPPSPASPAPLGSAYAQAAAHLDPAALLQHTAGFPLQHQSQLQAAGLGSLAHAAQQQQQQQQQQQLSPASVEDFLRLVSRPLSEAGTATPGGSELGLLPPGELAALRCYGLLGDSGSPSERSDPASLLSSPDCAAAFAARRPLDAGFGGQPALQQPDAARPPAAPGLATLNLPSVLTALCL